MWQCDWPWDADKVGWIFAILFNWFTRVWRSHDQSKSYFCSDNRFAKTQPAEPAPTMMWLYSDMLCAEVEKARLWELDVGGINALWWCSKDLWAIFEMPLDVTWKKKQQNFQSQYFWYIIMWRGALPDIRQGCPLQLIGREGSCLHTLWHHRQWHRHPLNRACYLHRSRHQR